jgi:hypothetical protein
MEKNQVMSLMSGSLDGNLNISSTTAYKVNSCWGYWQDYYYPYIVRESYPVYLQERSKDKAKQAYEIIKILKDKKLAKLEKVADFIDLMDELIKIL